MTFWANVRQQAMAALTQAWAQHGQKVCTSKVAAALLDKLNDSRCAPLPPQCVDKPSLLQVMWDWTEALQQPSMHVGAGQKTILPSLLACNLPVVCFVMYVQQVWLSTASLAFYCKSHLIHTNTHDVISW